jgi:hypothetical protein
LSPEPGPFKLLAGIVPSGNCADPNAQAAVDSSRRSITQPAAETSSNSDAEGQHPHLEIHQLSRYPLRMDLLDQKLLREMDNFHGIIAKSAMEKERLMQLERDGLAEAIQDSPREGVRIIAPMRYHLTELGRATVASLKSEE